jgi:hypothetical protein
MARAGYDPTVAKSVWQRYSGIGTRKHSDYYGLHPPPKGREQFLDKVLEKTSKIYNRHSAPKRTRNDRFPLLVPMNYEADAGRRSFV